MTSETTILSEWKSPCFVTSIYPTTDGQVWTNCYYSDTITLLDKSGDVIQEIKHTNGIVDIGFSPDNSTLWACNTENNVLELESGKLVNRFNTERKPCSICITASNDVIVGWDYHVTKFTTGGKKLVTTDSTGDGKPLLGRPHRMAECPVTQNIAVVNLYNIFGLDEGEDCVVVMDTDLNGLFSYHGEVPCTYQQTSQSEDKPFDPWGVVYDSVGNLIIGDSNNNRVLLISGRGEFLRIIHTDIFCISAVGIAKEDVLWTVTGYSNVKLLQYSSVSGNHDN
ncbi:uncharacterized protein LOC117333745 [Pecten maximus]|uniref:uncharacterized protein LOC117333745 n=1 Tax=Pecten maximus TaxID=6579 RepID=UPI001458D91A|nr:uncharacterized protein LOC117333745 [Pecten maximus]